LLDIKNAEEFNHSSAFCQLWILLLATDGDE